MSIGTLAVIATGASIVFQFSLVIGWLSGENLIELAFMETLWIVLFVVAAYAVRTTHE